MVQQQGFFDPPSELIGQVQNAAVDTVVRSVQELDRFVKGLFSTPAVPNAQELLVERVNELFDEGRKAAEGLRILSLEPLAEAANRALNELADTFFPARRLE
jgi:hypothetical protein